MSENTTRIVDLPDNNFVSGDHSRQPMNQNQRLKESDFDEMNTTYVPMNIHPNPYGNQVQPSVMSHPEYLGQHGQQPQQNQMHAHNHPPMHQPGHPHNHQPHMSREQHDMIQNMPVQRLPSRDIPMDQASYQQDEEIKPNFIPKPKLTNDYVKEYEQASEKSIRKQEKKKQKEESIDQIFTDLQLPVLLSLLFLIFQLPLINNLFYKYLKFLPLFHNDGNMNIYGFILKSSLFGSSFFLIQKFVKLLA